MRELAERVLELEKTDSLEARFTKLAHQVKLGSEIPQSELLLNIDGLQRQVDELSRVAGLDARFRELAERVGELEKTNSLEARLAKLANLRRQFLLLGRQSEAYCHPGHEHTRRNSWVRSWVAVLVGPRPRHPPRLPPRMLHQRPFC